MFPIGDAPNPPGVPVVNYSLIAANVAVFVLITIPLATVRPDPGDPALLEYLRVMTNALHGRVPPAELLRQVTDYDLFLFAHGFRPAAPAVSALFFSMFLHGGFAHLAGNMLFLWIYGDNVEYRLGPVGYLLAYLGIGVAATLFFAAMAAGSQVPMVGASGAISGVLGFYFLWFPRNRVRLLWFFPPFIMQTFYVPARLVLGLYVIADNLLPFLMTREATGVAHGAHLGGFFAGLGAAWLVDRRHLTARPAAWTRPEPRAGAVDEEIGAAIAAGRMAEAAEAYFARPAATMRGALAPEESLALAQWLRDHGHPEAALVVLRRHIRDHPRGPGLAEAHVAAGLVQLDLAQPAAAYQHFLSALDLDPAPEVAALARRGLAAVETFQKRRGGRPR